MWCYGVGSLSDRELGIHHQLLIGVTRSRQCRETGTSFGTREREAPINKPEDRALGDLECSKEGSAVERERDFCGREASV